MERQQFNVVPVYLDHNATTPLDPRVLDAMLPYLREHYGNPASVHRYGRIARAALDQAREQVATLVNAHPSQVVFTSGGTEANNYALKGVAAKLPSRNTARRIAISAIEHSSVLGAAQALVAQGWECDSIAVDEQCRVSLAALSVVLKAMPRLVSVMMANNETGAIQDIAAISAQVRAAGAIMHTDAVQAAGKIAIDFHASGAHLMSISAHKLHGPKGVGALVVDKSLDLEPLLHGGGHEMERRAGTENMAGIVGFGAAAILAHEELASRNTHLQTLRDTLEQRLRVMPGVVIFAAQGCASAVGAGAIATQVRRIANTVLIGVPAIEGETLLMELDRHDIAVSSGSACASGDPEPSHVLLAMGVDPDLARRVIRISLGKDNTLADIDKFITVLTDQITRVQVSTWG